MNALAVELFPTATRTSPVVTLRSAPAADSASPVADEAQGGLDEVLRHPGIWRRSASTANVRALASGWAELDGALPGGGWPLGALTEILIETEGRGELSLLMPALAALTQQRRRVVFVAPPHVPYAPALVAHGVDLACFAQIDSAPADGAWSAEQCLRSGACGAVLLWARTADYTQLRRWQLAAESGGALGFLFRPIAAATQASPAALRLLVRADDEATTIEVLKCRGSFGNRASVRFRWQA